MEMTLTQQSKRQSVDSSPTLRSVIESWVFKLAVNAGANLNANAQKVFVDLWCDDLSDLSPDQAEAALRKTLRECAFWPVKVADIRKNITHAEDTAEMIAAHKAWDKALLFRRRYWRADLPGQRTGDAPKLSDRLEQSMLDAGVLAEYDTEEALHVWTKKRFIELFLAYGEINRDKHLLPQGQYRDMLTELGQAKMLPAQRRD